MRKTCYAACVTLLLAGCAEQNVTVKPGPQNAGYARSGSKPSTVITTSVLLQEMIDLSRLMELPDPAYKTIQHSSYDRASTGPENQETWFANGDRGQFLRTEEKNGRKENVMMEADGPGAIVRIWSANPNDGGTLRIYIDGSETPAIEGSMQKILGGEFPGLPQPIAGMRARGWNLYFPIPYAKHCKVTGEGNYYYHVNFRTYEKGTKVESFQASDFEKLQPKIKDVAARLADVRRGGGPPEGRVREPFKVELSPRREVQLAQIEGSKAICGLLFHINASDLKAAARETVLRIKFDGEVTVECPLGDFYGSAALIPYESFPLGVTDAKPQDLWCHWWMPFKENARVSVITYGKQTVAIDGAVATVPYKWNKRSLLFHAKWRITRDIPGRPFIDWPHLHAKGEGRFVGGALHVTNNIPDWWGEGDEKIYVDGEKFPSHFGTGSEDYYGYAWCSPERFVHAYHAQPGCQGPRNYGSSYVSRFHIIDDIPFTTAFQFDMEHWMGTSRVNAAATRAAVSYWYAKPGSEDFFKPLKAEDVRYQEVPEYKGIEVKGAREGERMRAAQKTGVVEVQALGEPYSCDQQLWWREGKPGDRLVLRFPADTTGKHHVILKLTKAADYGIHQIYINDQKAGAPIDLYNDGLTQAEYDVGEFELKEKANTLTVEIVGKNPKAEPKYMFGIDYLLVK